MSRSKGTASLSENFPIPKNEVTIILPDYVRICFSCKGKGETLQTFTAGCGMGYFDTMAKCETCKSLRLLYVETCEPVHESVVHQVRQMNGAPPNQFPIGTVANRYGHRAPNYKERQKIGLEEKRKRLDRESGHW